MDVFSYLKQLINKQPLIESKLYSDPWTCRAIFRYLPALAKQYILRLIFVTSPVSGSTLASWVDSSHLRYHEAILYRLLELKIILKKKDRLKSTTSATPESQSLYLNPDFQKQLQLALSTNGKDRVVVEIDQDKDKHRPSISELDKDWQLKWDNILSFMIPKATISSKRNSREISKSLKQLLVKTGLMQLEGTSSESYKLTSYGFQFLMKDIYAQIWILLLAYIESSDISNQVAILSFLFQLSFLKLGKGYKRKKLSPFQQSTLLDLNELGLIYWNSSPHSSHSIPLSTDPPKYYYPTRLAINLSSGKLGEAHEDLTKKDLPQQPSKTLKSTTAIATATTTTLSSVAQKPRSDGFIIVESNYNVYAYTSSDLMISILSLFLELIYRLPNLVVASVTRDSIRSALINGITADQIVQFLRQNAHPQTFNRRKIGEVVSDEVESVPETVVDQIRLWESERKRIAFENAVLYDHFGTVENFDRVLQHAMSHPSRPVLWANREKELLCVRTEYHSELKEFIRKNIT